MKYTYVSIFLCITTLYGGKGHDRHLNERARQLGLELHKSRTQLSGTKKLLKEEQQKTAALLATAQYLYQKETARQAYDSGICSSYNRAVANSTMAVLAAVWAAHYWVNNYYLVDDK